MVTPLETVEEKLPRIRHTVLGCCRLALWVSSHVILPTDEQALEFRNSISGAEVQSRRKMNAIEFKENSVEWLQRLL
jgi:hypothetical protein